jgi:ATP-binding protein involved in chromosome partitioning
LSVDPRYTIIGDRLAGVRRVLAVAGSKGGIGKSLVSTSLALAGADAGLRVGLFDLDFTSPSDHVILGVEERFPEEQFGIDPHRAHGIDLMSVAFFLGEAPAPLRGAEATSALLELLAITRWGDLDLLVLDMPPGLGDTTLDVIRLLPGLEFLLLGTGSRVVIESVRRALALLTELEVPLAGVFENLQREPNVTVETLAERFGVPFLGALPYDPEVETALGDVDRLRETEFFGTLRETVSSLLDSGS